MNAFFSCLLTFASFARVSYLEACAFRISLLNHIIWYAFRKSLRVALQCRISLIQSLPTYTVAPTSWQGCPLMSTRSLLILDILLGKWKYSHRLRRVKTLIKTGPHSNEIRPTTLRLWLDWKFRQCSGYEGGILQASRLDRFGSCYRMASEVDPGMAFVDTPTCSFKSSILHSNWPDNQGAFYGLHIIHIQITESEG